MSLCQTDDVHDVRAVHHITPESRDIPGYTKIFAYGLVQTQSRKLLVQRRSSSDPAWPDALMLFGGWVEPGETFRQALCREFKEELEVMLSPQEPRWLGALTFARRKSQGQPRRQALCGLFYWHDRDNRIGTCREDTPETYPTAKAIAINENLHPAVSAALDRSLSLGLIPS